MCLAILAQQEKPIPPFASPGSRLESDAPRSKAKAAVVGGLDAAPPNKGIVLCVDEKPPRFLERARLYQIPDGAKSGYERHGATTLLAALEVSPERCLQPVRNDVAGLRLSTS